MTITITRFSVFPVALIVALSAPAASGSQPPVTWDEVRKLPADCPIVYDNDWLKDTTDDEYLFARAHLGRANLKGIVLSKDQWDHGRQYKVKDGLDDFDSDLAACGGRDGGTSPA